MSSHLPMYYVRMLDVNVNVNVDVVFPCFKVRDSDITAEVVENLKQAGPKIGGIIEANGEGDAEMLGVLFKVGRVLRCFLASSLACLIVFCWVACFISCVTCPCLFGLRAFLFA